MTNKTRPVIIGLRGVGNAAEVWLYELTKEGLVPIKQITQFIEGEVIEQEAIVS